MKIKFVGQGWYKIRWAGQWYFFMSGREYEVPEPLGRYLVSTGQFVMM